MESGRKLALVAAAGDVAILLIFAAAGRASHHEVGAESPAGIVATALPFLVGWAIAAWRLKPYEYQKLIVSGKSARAAAGTWLLAGVIGLFVRSLLEFQIVPLPFVVITLGFNGVLLVAWRALLPRLARQQ
ncbi:MAG: DUF3054 domain-containing protein [Chloroflexota bacterium]